MAKRLGTQKVELCDLLATKVDHITLIDEEGTFWLWPIIDERVDSNSPCQ